VQIEQDPRHADGSFARDFDVIRDFRTHPDVEAWIDDPNTVVRYIRHPTMRLPEYHRTAQLIEYRRWLSENNLPVYFGYPSHLARLGQLGSGRVDPHAAPPGNTVTYERVTDTLSDLSLRRESGGRRRGYRQRRRPTSGRRQGNEPSHFQGKSKPTFLP
jgi:hypothetical protein